MSDEVNLLKHVYDRFNARDMETVLSMMRAEAGDERSKYQFRFCYRISVRRSSLNEEP